MPAILASISSMEIWFVSILMAAVVTYFYGRAANKRIAESFFAQLAPVLTKSNIILPSLQMDGADHYIAGSQFSVVLQPRQDLLTTLLAMLLPNNLATVRDRIVMSLKRETPQTSLACLIRTSLLKNALEIYPLLSRCGKFQSQVRKTPYTVVGDSTEVVAALMKLAANDADLFHIESLFVTDDEIHITAEKPLETVFEKFLALKFLNLTFSEKSAHFMKSIRETPDQETLKELAEQKRRAKLEKMTESQKTKFEQKLQKKKIMNRAQ